MGAGAVGAGKSGWVGFGSGVVGAICVDAEEGATAGKVCPHAMMNMFSRRRSIIVGGLLIILSCLSSTSTSISFRVTACHLCLADIVLVPTESYLAQLHESVNETRPILLAAVGPP